jgi:hypothetical protein
MSGGQARYVYGITRSGGLGGPPAAGVEGQPVTQVEHGPVAALVSEGPEVPVKANRRNLMAHTEVLQHVVASDCVLPMRFGVVMPSEEAVAEELLAAHEEALVEQLEAFEGLVELDLKVTCPEDVLLRSVLAERPELAELRERIRGMPDDATYFDRIRLGEQVAAAVEDARKAVLQRACRRLEPHALSTSVSEPAHEQMLVNVAFLVDRDHVAAFDAEADALARDLGDELRCKYVGPLPPFHFVETAADQGSAAWA